MEEGEERWNVQITSNVHYETKKNKKLCTCTCMYTVEPHLKNNPEISNKDTLLCPKCAFLI